MKPFGVELGLTAELHSRKGEQARRGDRGASASHELCLLTPDVGLQELRYSTGARAGARSG
eukprot:10956492-Heterocapsa_arctica.AAC.1